MNHLSRLAGLAALVGAAATPALAQEKIKIGVIVTTSGPAAALGRQVRDGFALAVKDLGGKMGGKDVEVAVVDDELKPDAAVTKVKGLLERDKVDFVVGPIFSNILQAIHKPVIDSHTFLVSPNAGPSSYAGQGTSLGASFEQLAAIIDLMDGHRRIGVCLDTCHLLASGYDLCSPEGYASTFKTFGRLVGSGRSRTMARRAWR